MLFKFCCFLKFQEILICGAGSAYPSGAPEITPSFWWGSCCLYFSFLYYVICTIFCLFVFFVLSSMQLLLQKARHRESDQATTAAEAVLANFLKALYFRR